MRLRKQVEQLTGEIENQAVAINTLLASVRVLECDHVYVPNYATEERYVSYNRELTQSCSAYTIKCELCGKVKKELTYEEYLEAKIKHDDRECRRKNDQVKDTLAKLREEAK